MSRAIIIEKTGGAENLKLSTTQDRQPGKGEVLIRHTAIGVNFIDIYHRQGLYPLPTMPAVLGVEACGFVEAAGPGVEGIEIGGKYAYATAPAGAYCEARIIDSKYLVAVPENILDDQVAAVFFKALTAHYLLRRTFFVKPRDRILVHAAAGGVGQVICQWAKHLQAQVIGTVGSDEKVAIASKNGCDHVINYNKDNFAEKVKAITNGEGVHVVYDSVGQKTFIDSLECLMTFGLMVSFGNASGVVPPFDISLLTPKSLFLTRPSLFSYKENKMELILSANEVFDMITQKVIRPNITKKYKLAEAEQAHKDLESRKTTGSIILIP